MEVTAVTLFSYRVAPSVLIVQILTVSPEMIGWGVFHQEFHARISCWNGPKNRHQIREVLKKERPFYWSKKWGGLLISKFNFPPD